MTAGGAMPSSFADQNLLSRPLTEQYGWRVRCLASFGGVSCPSLGGVGLGVEPGGGKGSVYLGVLDRGYRRPRLLV